MSTVMINEETGALDSNVFYYYNFLNELLENTLPPAPKPIPPVDHTKMHETPLTQIQYKPEFAAVMNLYRGFLQAGEFSPRFLVLLAFVTRHCPANYTAWKHRRDIVASPTKFLRSCHCLPISPMKWRPHFPPLEADARAGMTKLEIERKEAELERLRKENPGYSYAPFLDGKQCLVQQDDAEPLLNELTPGQKLVVAWTPHLRSVFAREGEQQPLAFYQVVVEDRFGLEEDSSAEHARGSLNKYVYDPWMAAAWELRSMRFASVFISKSFQTWNHRKEVLSNAASQTSASLLQQSIRSSNELDKCLLSSQSEFLSFSDFDERPLCAEVLRRVDSKNYHVWSHRAWFVDFVGLSSTNEGLLEELRFCDEMLQRDIFNNSAWSHRMFIVKKRLLLPQTVAADTHRFEALQEPKELSSCAVFPVYFPRSLVMNRIEAATNVTFGESALTDLLEEVDYAIRYALMEPRNECPFTYAVGVAHLLETTLLGTVAERRARPITDPTKLARVSTFYSQIIERLREKVGSTLTSSKWPPPEHPSTIDALKRATAYPAQTEAELSYVGAVTALLESTEMSMQLHGALFRLHFNMARCLTLWPQADQVDSLRELSARLCDEGVKIANRLAATEHIRKKFWGLEASEMEALRLVKE